MSAVGAKAVALVVVGAGIVCFVALCRQASAALDAVDDGRARSAGIRKLAGRHLTLYTDLASGPEVDRLPAVFDRAVPLWAEYFGIDGAKTRSWRVRGFLIGDRDKFDVIGVMPTEDDVFAHGLSRGDEFWLFEQPSPYYRRHLLLHEGTHAFMQEFLGGGGPGWYMEGMAELFGTHRLDEQSGTVQLRVMPRERGEAPMWGRVKLLRDAVAKKPALDLAAVMAIDNRRPLGNTDYAWCWAAAKFLDSHPRYRDRFRTLASHVSDRDFNDVVRRTFAKDWDELSAEWQAYIATLDFGFDFERMAIEFRRGTARNGKRAVPVAADRGWQSSGIWMDAGTTYHVSASGRYQIAAEKTEDGVKPWACEPGGITIEYYEGRPLGMLLGTIVDEGAGTVDVPPAEAGLTDVIAIGLGRVITPEARGTLYLRVNDSAGQLGDNRGALTITVED